MSMLKKLAIILIPSILLFAYYFIVIKTDDYVEVENTEDKITVLLITNESCEECKEQAEIFDKVAEETEDDFFNFDTLDINSPVYKDVAEILKINGYPTIASFAPTGEVLYSRTGLHNEDQVSQVKGISLESFADILQLKREYSNETVDTEEEIEEDKDSDKKEQEDKKTEKDTEDDKNE